MAPDQLNVCAVPVDRLGAVWPGVAPWFRDAFARNPEGTQSLRATRGRIARGRYLLLLAGDADAVRCAAILERGAPRGVATVAVVAAGGERHAAFAGPGQALWRAIMGIAREQGAARVRVIGRPGWARWCAKQEGRRVGIKQVILDIGV